MNERYPSWGWIANILTKKRKVYKMILSLSCLSHLNNKKPPLSPPPFGTVSNDHQKPHTPPPKKKEKSITVCKLSGEDQGWGGGRFF